MSKHEPVIGEISSSFSADSLDLNLKYCSYFVIWIKAFIEHSKKALEWKKDEDNLENGETDIENMQLELTKLKKISEEFSTGEKGSPSKISSMIQAISKTENEIMENYSSLNRRF
jgi:hypothetical protein